MVTVLSLFWFGNIYFWLGFILFFVPPPPLPICIHSPSCPDCFSWIVEKLLCLTYTFLLLIWVIVFFSKSSWSLKGCVNFILISFIKISYQKWILDSVHCRLWYTHLASFHRKNCCVFYFNFLIFICLRRLLLPLHKACWLCIPSCNTSEPLVD